jgi:hypothetical protein
VAKSAEAGAPHARFARGAQRTLMSLDDFEDDDDAIAR